ncbi:MAG: FAD binding domain-containing protein [Pseudomonadota bacterium]
MRLPKFDYLAPKTREELSSLLLKYKDGAKILGGGTELLVSMKQNILTPRYVINLKTVSGLDYITSNHEGGMSIGALTTLNRIEESPEVKSTFPVLAQAAGSVASPHIRQMATIGGNICLDARCGYYNQSKEWRKVRETCLKQGGTVCHAVNSLCESACPIHMDVSGYIALIAEGRIEEALEIIRDTNPLAGICGRVCHHPCETVCRRGELDAPIAIAALKRFAVDYGAKKGIQTPIRKATPKGIKVAIVGSGPGGLTAAYHLARWGYEVTVFEALPVAGGAIAWGIPEYRLPREILQADIQFITDLGVEIKTNSPVGKDGISFKSLTRQGYKALFLDTGAGEGYELPIQGTTLKNVLKGVEFLKRLNFKEKITVGKMTVVIGGGNVAIDVAKCALRLGAKEVQLACLESRDEMPAIPEEIEEAEVLGVKLHCGWGPIRIIEGNGAARGVELQKCISVFDRDWKFNPAYDENVRMILDADTVIIAVGQVPDLSFLEGSGVKISGNKIPVDSVTLATNKPGIFAGGDVVTGPGKIVGAMSAGLNAAISIDNYLQGKELYQDRTLPSFKKTLICRSSEEKGFSRQEMPSLPLAERLKGFKEVNLGFTSEMAQKEASRCLNCGADECAAIFSADTVPALIALGANVKIVKAGDENIIPLEAFYTGEGKKVNILTSDEFITEIQIPALPPHSGGVYLKHSVRNVIDFPLLGVATVITLSNKSVCKELKIVVCGASSAPFRATEAENLLKGKKANEKIIQEAAQEAAAKARIISTGGRAVSLNYRKKIIMGLVNKSIHQAWKQALSN